MVAEHLWPGGRQPRTAPGDVHGRAGLADAGVRHAGRFARLPTSGRTRLGDLRPSAAWGKTRLIERLEVVAHRIGFRPSQRSVLIEGARRNPPNVVLIVSDDAGWADFGFQGNETIRTPRLDSIAAEGVRFAQGYVTAAVCSPSRAGLLTGRYQQRFGHQHNFAGNAGESVGLPTSERTLADALGGLGYETIALGKLAPRLRARPAPQPPRLRRVLRLPLRLAHVLAPEGGAAQGAHLAAAQRRAGRRGLRVPDRPARRGGGAVHREAQVPAVLPVPVLQRGAHADARARSRPDRGGRGRGQEARQAGRDDPRPSTARSAACSTRCASTTSRRTPWSCSSTTMAARGATLRTTRRCSARRARPTRAASACRS